MILWARTYTIRNWRNERIEVGSSRVRHLRMVSFYFPFQEVNGRPGNSFTANFSGVVPGMLCRGDKTQMWNWEWSQDLNKCNFWFEGGLYNFGLSSLGSTDVQHTLPSPWLAVLDGSGCFRYNIFINFASEFHRVFNSVLWFHNYSRGIKWTSKGLRENENESLK